MRVEMLLRLIGGLSLSVATWYFSNSLIAASPFVADGVGVQQTRYALAMSAVAFGLGVVITPYFTTRPFRWIIDVTRRLPASDLVAALIGLLLGLLASALLAIPLSMLPSYFGQILPIVACVFLARLGISLGLMRKKDLLGLLSSRLGAAAVESRGKESSTKVILDTSAIIDGRIADISQTGFLMGPMLIPRFVLNELQHIADSPDMLRRNRGRRGLDMLNKLQKESLAPIQVVDTDDDGNTDVDGRLIKMAKQLECAIITNDFNLNRVAALQGVRVLNINELANAVKPVVLPGEDMVVRIIQEGKELGQGVGYLDDGTMVVVEGGRKFINSEVPIVVSRVLQTVAGRMIFAHPRSE
ncbi:MAG: PIN/TRAM domain-containing protein [Chloroflexota bacterium]